MKKNKQVQSNSRDSQPFLIQVLPESYSNLDNASSKEEDDATDDNQEEFDDNNDEASYPSDPSLN